MNKIFILRIEMTMAKKNVAKDAAKPFEPERPKSFVVLAYPEDDGWDKPIKRCEYEGWPYAYIIHDSDLDKDNAEKKAHVHILIRLKNPMSKSAFVKKFEVQERFAQGCSDYKAFCLYLVHADYDSVKAGKHQYPSDQIKGSFGDEARRIIDKFVRENSAQSHDDDRNILEILDFIDSCDSYIPTASLCRWCCQMGYFSTYRRCAGIIREALREHNLYSADSVETKLLRKRVKWLQDRMTEQEKELEKAYGDLLERVRNPFDGSVLNSGEEPKWAREETMALLNKNIAELKRMAK